VKYPSMHLPAALGLLLLANGPAFAGNVYSFASEMRDGFNDKTEKGRLLVEGERFRIEREPDDNAMLARVEVSNDGGAHRFALDPEARTFYEVEKIDEKAATSYMFHLVPLNGDRLVENVKVETAQGAEPETTAGSTVRRHEITLSYDLTIKIPPPQPPPGMPSFKGQTETVRGTVKAHAVYWMAEDKAPLPGGIFVPQIRTGFPEVDGKLAGPLAALRGGLAVKQQVTISTEGSYIPARSTSVTTMVSGPKPITTQAALFEVPKGFRMHKPEITRPGLSSAPMPFPSGEGPP
jgi:hypothetical protein